LDGVPRNNKYLKIPPVTAIQIDTRADTGNFSTAMDYVYKKTDDLLEFGVQKVIWFFTSSRKAMIATSDEKWITVDWKETIPVLENIEINLDEILKEK
jgi:hypothetical protein